MGLAPYGEPKYADLILKEVVDLKEDGSFKINMRYFSYCNGLRMINRKFENLFGAPARKPETQITQHYMDVAASIQQVTEEMMLKMARYAHRLSGQKYLCLAGGVALNCVGNGHILKEAGFEDIWIQPASGDAGGALGAALSVWYQYSGNKRIADGKDKQKSSLLGPAYNDTCIESFLKKENIPYKKIEKAGIANMVSKLLAHGSVVGWFQGRMEFGPRALGSRSILGDPRNSQMQSRMNLKIKFRESFRPFAPSVMEEHAQEWFELGKKSPYMLLVADIKENKRLPENAKDKALQGFDKLKAQRSVIPAVTHVDYSARIQTVSREDNPLFYELINAFYQKTGCPVVINTSFNVRGEPLVCTPLDAFRCFMRTDMDFLAIGSFILSKKEQKTTNQKIKQQEVLELD